MHDFSALETDLLWLRAQQHQPSIRLFPPPRHDVACETVRHPRRTKLTFLVFYIFRRCHQQTTDSDNLSSSINQPTMHGDSTNPLTPAFKPAQPSLSSPLSGWLPPSIITHRPNRPNRPTRTLPGSVSDRHQPASPRHPNQPPGSQGGGGGRPIGNQPWTDRQVSNFFFFPRRE